MLQVSYHTRKVLPREQQARRARPNYKAQVEFPGGRTIPLTYAQLKRVAQKATRAAATQAAVASAVAEGNGATAHAAVGGGGNGSVTYKGVGRPQASLQ